MTFQPGDIVEHVTHGQAVVIADLRPTRNIVQIRISYQDGFTRGQTSSYTFRADPNNLRLCRPRTITEPPPRYGPYRPVVRKLP